MADGLKKNQYHVYFGSKIFYLIEPTPKNLKIYSDWATSKKGVGGSDGRRTASSNRVKYVFLPDLIVRAGGIVHEVPLGAGQTLFIPSGWIHAVHTPDEDTLVFGGNFVHRHSLEMQLRIHRLEGSMRVGPDFRFPNYQKLMWYAARDFVGECAELLRKMESRDDDENESEKGEEANLRISIVKNDESIEEVCSGGSWGFKKTTKDGKRAGQGLERQRARILCSTYPPRILQGYGALAKDLSRWSTSRTRSAIEQYPANMNVVSLASELYQMMKQCIALLGKKGNRG